MFSNLSARHRFLIRILPVFLAALVIRILCAWPAFCSPELLKRLDTGTYLLPAQALAEDGRMCVEPGSPELAVQRPPGYIVFLAALIVFGCSTTGFGLAGCLVDALTVFPVALTGKCLAGRRAGFWAAILYALNLTALANAPLLIADTLFGFLCACQVLCFVRVLRTKRLSAFLCGTVFAAAAVLTKPANLPVLLFLIPVVLGPILLRSWKKAVCGGLLTALVFSAMVLPWLLRNHAAGAGFALDRNTGFTARHNTAAILARVNKSGDYIEDDKLIAEAEQAFAADPERYASIPEQEKWYLDRYRETVLAHPVAAASTHLFQVWILLPDLPDFLQNLGLRSGDRGTMEVLRRDGLLAAFRYYMDGSYTAGFLALPFLLVSGVFYVLTTCGAWMYVRRRAWGVLVLLAVFVLYYLAVPGPVVVPRYQIPALPFACAVAGAFISACGIRRWRTRRSCPRCNP